jgi:RsiW-degrading membrane proteinase PrsW (M82 family)
MMLVSVILILVLSFIPMLLYALILWSLDRYEKEPFALLALAFGWGAVPSIILALILQIVLDIPLMVIGGSNQLVYDLLGGSVVAPLTEEAVKGFALLALLLILRREIDSPIDGLIYGGLVGFGFAAVENVFYLFGALSQGTFEDVLALAFLRAGVFGLNHAMYTGFTGLGVALFLDVRSKVLKPLLLLGGFGLAVVTHALHNALATFTAYGGLVALLGAVVADWAGVFVLLAVAIATFILERRRIAAYGEALVQRGVIPEDEVGVLTSTLRRRKARWSALFQGNVPRWQALRRYHQALTEAAFAWHRLTHGDGGARERLDRLEADYQRYRRALAPGPQTAVA